jgi:hypothetical protein
MRIGRQRRHVLAVSALVLLAACSSGGGGDPAPTPTPTTGALSVVNGSSYTISELYVSPASAATWGADQLSSSIAAGGSFTLTDIPPGTYDFRAVASDGTTFWQTDAVVITAGTTHTWTLLPAQPTTGELTVVNHHCVPIDELYVAPTSASVWGPNQLSGSVASGGSFTVSDIPAGQYDLAAVGADGVHWEEYAITIAAGEAYSWSLYMPSGTGCLEVQNGSSYAVAALYTPPSSEGCTYDAWGDELLGGQTIPSGYAFTVSNLPAGYHDLAADAVGGLHFWEWCDAYVTAGQTYTWTLGN